MADIFNKFENELTAEEIKRLRLPTTRRQQFFDIIKVNFNNIVKISLLVILLSLPLILMLGVVQPMLGYVIGSKYDFLGNSLTGFPGTTDSLLLAQIEVEQTNMAFFLVMIVPITLMGPGLAGLFYTIRNLVWGKNITVKVDFWKGLKLGWKQYTLLCFLVGVVLALCMAVLTVFNIQSILGVVDGWGIIAVTFVIIAAIITVSVVLFMLPQLAMFDMKFTRVLKNSAFLATGAFPYTIFMILMSVLPFFLSQFLGALGSLVDALMFMCGYAILALLYVEVVQSVLDKYIFPKVKSSAHNRGIYKAKEETVEGDEAPEVDAKPVAKATKQRYVNPKKKKKVETEITPLSEHYSRSDLEKLRQEKEKALAEMDESDDD